MKEITPGPWKVEEFDWDGRPASDDVEYFATIYGPRETGSAFIIADMCGSITGSYACGAGQANARLIAAAPEMLAALEQVAPTLYNPFEPDNQSEAYKQVEAAIRKAKGESL
jgi:hypothetical protein